VRGGHWRGPRGRPPWWPEDEPFPPQGGWRGARWGAMRGGFMRRFVAIFLAAMVMAVVAATFLFWLLASALGAPDVPGDIARGVALLVLFLGLGFAIRSLRRLAAPVGDVIEAVGRVADGDLSARVRERGPREVRALARAFNAMSERLEASEGQRRRLLADVSHELRNPLSVVQGNLEALVDGVHQADEAHLRAILDETKVLSRLVDDLRTLSLAEAGALALHREAADVSALARETVSSFAAQADAAGVAVEASAAPGLPLAEVDPVRVREVLANLVANAIRYTPRGGRVRVDAQRDGPSTLAVTVSDSGAGISAEALTRVFDRFYKSAESRGAGLGLAIAKNLVEAHGGAISATSVVGQGTQIRFTLPIEPV
jgi:signal transduction histidine kinase